MQAQIRHRFLEREARPDDRQASLGKRSITLASTIPAEWIKCKQGR